MDSFKLHIEIQKIFKGLFFLGIVLFQQRFYSIGNVFWKYDIHATNFIRQFLIMTNCEPIFSGITGSNAKLLSGEIDTYLGGRYVEFVSIHFLLKNFWNYIKQLLLMNLFKNMYYLVVCLILQIFNTLMNHQNNIFTIYSTLFN